MDAERWRRLDELFQQVLDQPPEGRLSFLAESCPEDPDLRREVEAMLAADAAEGATGALVEAGSGISSTDERLAGIVRSGAEEITVADTALQGDDDPQNALPFDVLGPYTLIEELGQGGLATVYLAERSDEQFSMQVAIKLLRRGFDTPDLLERLRLERQILARLEHPNIARLIDGGTAPDGRPYFVMERIEGERIDRWCEVQTLDLTGRLDLFCQLCDAVQTAHRRLVLHRDIKPSNILVTRDGIPKLLDFGIAKLLDAPDEGLNTLASGFSTLTDTGMRLLTPEFASPEQVRGEALTTASDVYSLGVLLYHLITGEAPYTFDRRRPAEIERTVCEARPPRPSAVVWARDRGSSDLPTRRSLGWPRRPGGDDLDTILQTALRKEPERRYGSVARLARDLRHYQQDMPISARPDTLRYRTGKFVRRHRAAVSAGTLLVLVLLGGVIATTWQAQVARRAQRQAEAQRELATQRQEQAERQRRRAEETTAFLVDLFDVSDPFRIAGEQGSATARELLDRGAERMATRSQDDPLLRATLMNTIGGVYRNLGLLESSEGLLEEALELRLGNPEAGIDDVLESHQALANLRIDQERFQDAEEFLERVVAERRDRLAASPEFAASRAPDLANALEDLATVKRALDKVPEAEGLLDEALGLYDTGDDALGMAQIQYTLGQIRRSQSDFETSEAVLREVLDVRQKHLGSNHPLVALTLNDLALTLQSAGNHGQAQQLFAEALATYRRIFGEDNHHVVSASLNVANALVNQRRPDDALRIYGDLEPVMLGLYGSEHPAMARLHWARARAHRVARRPEQAIPWARQALGIRLAHLGADHSSTLRSAFELAAVLTESGQPGAEAVLRALIDDMRGSERSQGINLSYPLMKLASLRSKAGDTRGAESLLREALGLRRSVLPVGHWEVAQAEGRLGRCLIRLGRLDEAEELLRSSHENLLGQDEAKAGQLRIVERYLEALEEAKATADTATAQL